MGARKTILLADDDRDDVELTLLHFHDIGFPHAFEVVSDGAEVLRRLDDALSGAAPLPDMVVMDLRMPRMSGEEVLRKLRENPRLAAIPAVIMSDSGDERDRQRCLEAGAAAYMSKPTLISDYKAAAAKLSALLGG